MSSMVYGISCVILWICIALNTWAMIRSNQAASEYHVAAAELYKAQSRCNAVSRKLSIALDHVQNNNIEAAMAALEVEEEVAE